MDGSERFKWVRLVCLAYSAALYKLLEMILYPELVLSFIHQRTAVGQAITDLLKMIMDVANRFLRLECFLFDLARTVGVHCHPTPHQFCCA